MMGCIVGEDTRTRGTKRKEVDLSLNGSISPTIRGQMKKAEYRRLFRGGLCGALGAFVALLAGRGSALTRSRGSHPSPRRGLDLAMSLKSCGMREGSTSLH